MYEIVSRIDNIVFGQSFINKKTATPATPKPIKIRIISLHIDCCGVPYGLRLRFTNNSTIPQHDI